MSNPFSLELFQPHLNTQFQISFEGHDPVILTLIEAKAIHSWQPDGVNRQAFSLVFKGDASQPALVQSLFELEHDSLANQMLFLVPIDQRLDGRYYEAVFT